MLKKGSKLYSILTGSCPKCHEESMYLNKNPYNLMEIYKMHEKCSNCNTRYKIEPSFFYGAMYVSYAVGIAFAVAAFIISYLIFNSSLKTAFIAIVLVQIALMPFTMRVSRNIWANMFIHFDKIRKKKKN
ncbi:DUF983 domain-containing protein [Flavobacterium sp.]|jgi:uncharacterized protein (DUF983 family)|uniref:DUF983 domain-containing protein n=1 Tax=Flavobacterium sp. TaxID=239 RepID=UPI002A824F61|nr:DUF983 domain-containing protein [Flavobacterium sp.]